jgi:hypothetical protein
VKPQRKGPGCEGGRAFLGLIGKILPIAEGSAQFPDAAEADAKNKARICPNGHADRPLHTGALGRRRRDGERIAFPRVEPNLIGASPALVPGNIDVVHHLARPERVKAR